MAPHRAAGGAPQRAPGGPIGTGQHAARRGFDMNRQVRMALAGAVLPMIAAAALQGCAVGMLKGAASSGSGGSGTSQPARTSAPSAADNAISTSVRSRFAQNAALKGLNLSVDTHDGVVTLRGQVAK